MIFIFLIIALVSVCDGQYPNGKIPGPRNINHAIAIVGAGPAGIHMALRLKETGFRNITIYEQTGRVGGSTSSTTHRGTTFDEPFAVQGIDATMRDLISRYLDNNDFTAMPPISVWSRDGGGVLQETQFMRYLLDQAKESLGTTSDTTARNALVSAMNTYVALYNQHFPNAINLDIINEPDWEDKFKSYGTIKDFLERNNIEVIAPLFYFLLTLKGLGYYDEVPALYGFLAVPGTFMSGMATSLQTGIFTEEIKNYYVKNGLQKIWNAIANAENLNIVYNSKIDRLRRPELSSSTSSFLRIRSSDGSTYWRQYDFVIWSGNMRSALKAWHWKSFGANAGPAPEEYGSFLRIKENTYRSSILADTELLDRGGSPYDTLIDYVKDKQDGPFRMVDAYALAQGQTNQTRYRAGNYSMNADGSDVRTVQIISFTRSPPTFSSAQSQFFSRIQNDFTPANVTFTGFNSAPVNPHFASGDITNSMIWKILKMQGKYGMWYTGASVAHDTAESMLKYNELLIKNMETPITDDGNVVN